MGNRTRSTHSLAVRERGPSGAVRMETPIGRNAALTDGGDMVRGLHAHIVVLARVGADLGLLRGRGARRQTEVGGELKTPSAHGRTGTRDAAAAALTAWSPRCGGCYKRRAVVGQRPRRPEKKPGDHVQGPAEKQHGAPVLHLEREDVRRRGRVLGRGGVEAEVLGQLERPLRQLAVEPREVGGAVRRRLDRVDALAYLAKDDRCIARQAAGNKGRGRRGRGDVSTAT